MSEQISGLQPVNLIAMQHELLTEAHSATARRAAHTVYHGGALLRQTALALLAGAELAEHDSPPEATLQVLTGKIRLIGQEQDWELGTGDLIAIPCERHSVVAVEDSVFLLSIRRDARSQQGARS